MNFIHGLQTPYQPITQELDNVMKIKLTEQQFKRIILKEQTDVEIDTNDAILVFGGTLKKRIPIKNAQYRVEKAVELYNQELAPNILMSGYKSMSDNKPPKEAPDKSEKQILLTLFFCKYKTVPINNPEKKNGKDNKDLMKIIHYAIIALYVNNKEQDNG